MAKDKKSFILYSDQKGIIDLLTDEQAGKVIKYLYSYVNDEDPIIEDQLLNLAIQPIKSQLKRDLKQWEESKEQKSYNGRLGNLKRYHKDLYDLVESQLIDLEFAEKQVAQRRLAMVSDSQPSGTVAKLAVNVNENVSVNVNDNVIKENNITPTAFSFFNSLVSLGADKNLANDWIKVRKTKKLTNTETALRGFKSEIDKSGKDINFVLTQCVLNSWGGFKSEWLNKTINSSISKKPDGWLSPG